MSGPVDARRRSPYSAQDQRRRALWAMTRPAFRLSPRVFFGWRAALLRLHGARLGHAVHVYPTTRVTFPWMLEIGAGSSVGEEALLYDLGEIRLGCRVTVSQRAHLCAGTHDYRDPAMPLIRSAIDVADDVWICADAFVGPGVSIGRGAVVGARAVVVRDVEAGHVVGGNPARTLKRREA